MLIRWGVGAGESRGSAVRAILAQHSNPIFVGKLCGSRSVGITDGTLDHVSCNKDSELYIVQVKLSSLQL